MDKLVKIKKALGKILFNFEEVTVGDITYVYEKIEVGEPVFIFNDEGEKTPAPDGTIEIEGSTVVIKDGVIESIEPVEVVEEEMEDEPNPLAELELRVTDLEARMNEIVNILNDTVLAVEDFSKEPEAKPINKKDKVKENFKAAPESGASKFFK